MRTARLWTVVAVVGLLASVAAGDWRRQAEERIARHRTSEVSVTVLDAGGTPLPAGTRARLTMTRSAYHWGTALSAKTFAALEPNHPYFRRIPELFNTVVLESSHKWSRYADPERKKLADRAVAWARKNHLAVRGHAMLWGADQHHVMPEPYHEAVTKSKPGLEDEFRADLDAHIARIGAEMPFIYEWDVVNEPIAEPHPMRYLGATTLEQQAKLIAHWLTRARKAAPQARLAINEYNILAGPHKGKDRRFHELCRRLVEMDAPLDTVGFQNHYGHGRTRRDPNKLYDHLERYAKLGLTLSGTEWDTFGGGWSQGRDRKEALQAKGEWLETFLTVFYSHPASTSFLMWGYWDGRHWKNEAALFQKDWTPKPALAVWKKLVLGQWRTDEPLALDESGSARLRAHHGLYELTVHTDGTKHTLPCTIDAKTRAIVLRLKN
jgi:GH35 family endo-1,4-beta-xylanase